MAFIAESARLQATLGTYGIQTQTPTQVEPIQIWPPAELIKVSKNYNQIFSALQRTELGPCLYIILQCIKLSQS